MHRGRFTARVRRRLARHPWIYWACAISATIGCAATIAQRVARLDDERAAWGDRREVLVASSNIEPGDRLEDATAVADYPSAIVPAAAVDGTTDVDDHIARQRVVAGEVITSADIAPRPGPLALVPDGWLAVAIIESPGSGAGPGDRVDVVSEGISISESSIVVGHVDAATLVAAPADAAPLIALAAENGDVTLLRSP